MTFKKSLKNLAILFFILILFSCSKENGTSQSGGENTAETNPTAEPISRGVPVEAKIIKSQTVKQNIPLTGVLNPLHAVDIIAEVNGKTTRIEKKLGDAVTQKDTLAFIDDEIPLSHYRQAVSQVLSAENNLKIAKLNLKSDEKLHKNDYISQIAFENSHLAVKTAEANLLSAKANLNMMQKSYKDTRIMSPISGLVSRKYINLGTMVTPGMPLYRVVDLSTLKVEVGIPQDNIQYVQVGSRADVIISALNDKKFEGQVRYISPQADESTGVFTVEIHVKNSRDLQIRGGMTARINLMLSDLNEQIVVPDYALVSKNGANHVYKIHNDMAELTEITVEKTFGSQVIVGQGVAEGDTIVIVGMKNLGVKTKVWMETVE